MAKSFKIAALAFLISLIIRLIYITCRKVWIGHAHADKPMVMLFWHGKLALMSFAFGKWSCGKSAKVIISDHKDGELITQVIAHFGIGAVRGSTSKNAVKALVGALRELKNGSDLIITPDGPRGPRHSVSDGCVTIPQKSGADIQILDYTASRFWQFGSWDGMILPKPFSTVTYTLSEPFSVAGLEMNEAKGLIAKKMGAEK